MSEYDEIANLCKLFLVNYSHYSRKENIDKILEKLQAALEEYFAPLALGVSVQEKVNTSDKVGK